MTHCTQLPLTSIDVGERVREDYGDLPALMASIKQFGLIQPIVVTPGSPPTVQNEANEYDEGTPPKLLVGGRRYYAHLALVELGDDQYSSIDVTFKDCLSDDDLVEIELEENMQRKDMSWQEECLGILKIHRIKTKRAASLGDEWNQTMTGIAIGRSRQRVTQVLPIARELENRDSIIWKCKGTDEALGWLLEQQELRLKQAMAERSLGQGKSLQLSSPAPQPSIGTARIVGGGVALFPSALVDSPDSQPSHEPQVNINISDYFEHRHCIVWMYEHRGEFDHIITDPPYAIDMGMLQQDSNRMDVTGTEGEHDVQENLALMRDFVPAAYETLKDKSFLVMFCDAMNFRFLHDLGVKAGFSVCRWPVVWCKPGAKNEAAGFNFTKATEFAIVMRKGVATLVNHQPLNWRCIAKGPQDKDFDHAFAKPKDLWTWFLEACTSPGQVVLDAFAGSGSGPCAFIQAGRQWRACEKAQQHVMELLRNVSKCYTEHFTGLKTKVNIEYNPTPNDPKA